MKDLMLLIALSLLRVTPIFIGIGQTPFARIPVSIRVFIVFYISISASFVMHGNGNNVIDLSVLNLVSELFLGLVIAGALQIAISSIGFWGRVVDMQVGFSAASVLDPASNGQESLIGSFYVLLAVTLFFLLGIHRHLLSFIYSTFQVFPLGTITFISKDFFVSLITLLFVFSMYVFFPISLGLWMLDIFIGLMSKTMPQMNIYFVMMPLKIGIGIFLLSLFMEKSVISISTMFEFMILKLNEVL